MRRRVFCWKIALLRLWRWGWYYCILMNRHSKLTTCASGEECPVLESEQYIGKCSGCCKKQDMQNRLCHSWERRFIFGMYSMTHYISQLCYLRIPAAKHAIVLARAHSRHTFRILFYSHWQPAVSVTNIISALIIKKTFSFFVVSYCVRGDLGYYIDNVFLQYGNIAKSDAKCFCDCFRAWFGGEN